MLVPLIDANNPYASMMLAVIVEYQSRARRPAHAVDPGAAGQRHSTFRHRLRSWTRHATAETTPTAPSAPL